MSQTTEPSAPPTEVAERELAEILERIERELADLEKRADRLMHEYGL